MFDHISKHLEVHQEQSAACCIFNSLLSVWKCGETRSFVFDMLLKRHTRISLHNVIFLTADCVAISANKTSLTFMAFARRLFRSFLDLSFFFLGSWSENYFIYNIWYKDRISAEIIHLLKKEKISSVTSRTKKSINWQPVKLNRGWGQNSCISN